MWNEGELFRFTYVYHDCELNERLAVYLGERHFHRGSDGVLIRNFAVQVVGEDTPTLCDGSLKKHMRKVEHESR